MTKRSRRLFLSIGINSTGYLGTSWKARKGNRLDFVDYDYYLGLTRKAHAARFDAVFFSDHPALMLDTEVRPLHSFEPLTLLTALAAQVPDVGLWFTGTTSYNSPYNLARRLQTLDHISGGRIIFNAVSSFNPAVAANYGNDPLPPREARYRKADEFMQLLDELWGSWDLKREGAVPEGRLWDNSSAHAVNHQGEFFNVAGPLNVPRGPQGRPVIAQAGASGDGIEFAARHGELIYCSLLSKQAAFEFGGKLRQRAAELGRPANAIKMFPALVPIAARTEAEARERLYAVTGAGTEEGLIAKFAQEHGLDGPNFDPDAPLDESHFAATPGQQRPVGFTQSIFEVIRLEKVSTRQLVNRLEGGHRLVVGTPDKIADTIIDWWESGAADGFNIQAAALPDELDSFAELVVPILQDRGVFPRDYDGSTLRERFDLPFPS
ncbi:MAG TPA: NtaA/DmoA family FMN-dependent monooxygenase [Devosiaceae bacterium]|nr:NtaA/DmoA family FMN-dependent monooxygenase [Devosiaceae bacterium]